MGCRSAADQSQLPSLAGDVAVGRTLMPSRQRPAWTLLATDSGRTRREPELPVSTLSAGLTRRYALPRTMGVVVLSGNGRNPATPGPTREPAPSRRRRFAASRAGPPAETRGEAVRRV